MTTVQIDDEAHALLLERVADEKQAATLQGKPIKGISKNKLVSDLIKRALRVPPIPPRNKKRTEPHP